MSEEKYKSKIKRITVDQHRELSYMKMGPPCQKHYARLPECHCEKYEQDLYEMTKQISNMEEHIEILERHRDQLINMPSDTMSIQDLYKYGFPVKLIKRLEKAEKRLDQILHPNNNPESSNSYHWNGKEYK